MKAMRVKLRGKAWRMVFRTPRDASGYCESPKAPGKTITIAPKQGELDLLDTIIHECLHACLWDLCEEAVMETATDIAKVLTRCGYRRVTDDQ